MLMFALMIFLVPGLSAAADRPFAVETMSPTLWTPWSQFYLVTDRGYTQYIELSDSNDNVQLLTLGSADVIVHMKKGNDNLSLTSIGGNPNVQMTEDEGSGQVSAGFYFCGGTSEFAMGCGAGQLVSVLFYHSSMKTLVFYTANDPHPAAVKKSSPNATLTPIQGPAEGC